MITRLNIEERITRELLQRLIAQGYALGVNDGEETVLRNSRDAEEVYKLLGTTDADYILVAEATRQGDGVAWRQIGWVMLIWGNGIDLISNYSLGLEAAVGTVQDWVNMLEVAA
jgi:hypothetical protein